jgi:glucose-1-phosphate thymidylyltransferase
MKGLILAASSNTRLYPTSSGLTEQLLPVYDKPMIYYSLSNLINLNIKDIGIVCRTQDKVSFQHLLSTVLENLNIQVSYIIQEEQLGTAHALRLARDSYLNGSDVCMVLGDNLFIDQDFDPNFQDALIYTYPVANPKNFCVLEFSKDFTEVVSLEEKPQNPKSNFIVPGIYFYKSEVLNLLDSLKPSTTGAHEITDFNTLCLNKKLLKAKLMNPMAIWMDMGSVDSLFAAAGIIKNKQMLTGTKIGCIEEVAYRNHFIDKNKLKEIANEILFSDYGKYINSIE